MKTTFIKDILGMKDGTPVVLYAFVKARQNLKKTLFLCLYDSTGQIQVVLEKEGAESGKISVGSSVRVNGVVSLNKLGSKEIVANRAEIICSYKSALNPFQQGLDVCDERFTNLVFGNRHIFLRNEKVANILRLRHYAIGILHNWFRENSFILVDPPILTQLTLHNRKNTTFSVNYFGTEVFLTQCAAFYLEAFVPVFERVYAIYPSFRAEQGRSPRHTSEFTQVKAEIGFADMSDMMQFVDKMICDFVKRLEHEGSKEMETLGLKKMGTRLKRPFPIITYDEAVGILEGAGHDFRYGKSLANRQEAIITEKFRSPVWVKNMPATVEPFPYKLAPENPSLTMTADLLAPDGYGELLGIAEKIDKKEDLLRRMAEKKISAERMKEYAWYVELRENGSVPHSGFGMGLERLLRWCLKLPRTIDAIPFPRVYGRAPYP